VFEGFRGVLGVFRGVLMCFDVFGCVLRFFVRRCLEMCRDVLKCSELSWGCFEVFRGVWKY